MRTRANWYITALAALLLAFAPAAFADPVLTGATHGVSRWSSQYMDEFPAAVPGGPAGDQLVAVFGTGKNPEPGVPGACPSIGEAGWTLVFSKSSASFNNSVNLCAYTHTSDGTESSITVYRPDMNGTSWWIGRISGGNAVSAAAVTGGNPPMLNFGSAAATVVLAAEFGLASTPPAGYTLDFAAGSGGINFGILSVAYAMAYGSSEDPGAFAPLGSIAATIGIR